MSKTVKIATTLTEEAEQRLVRCEEILGSTRAEAIRLAIDNLHSLLCVEAPENGFTGEEETRKAKWVVIECFRRHQGPSMAARAAGTTKKSLELWMATDETFAEFARDAWAESTEIADAKLWSIGVEGENIKGLFGHLNAKHESYGPIKQAYIDQKLAQFMNKVVLPLVASRLSSADMASLLRELGENTGLPLLSGAQEGEV